MMTKNHFSNPGWRSVLAAGLVVLALCGAPHQLSGADDVAELKLDKNGIPEGYMIVDGDIIVPDGTSSAGPFPTELWPPGNPTIIPYVFDTTTAGCPCVNACNCTANGFTTCGQGSNACLTATNLCAAVIEQSGCPGGFITCNQTAMLNAMAIWEAIANVDFRPRAGEDDFILIRDSSNDCNPLNNSFVGMIGGQQVLNITAWGSQRTILHELGHALGFEHEQQRSDRNTFVQINCQNQTQGCCAGVPCDSVAFGILDLGEYGPYDFGSIMHYSACAFASTACSASPGCPNSTACPFGGRTITVLQPNTSQWQNIIGTGTAPSKWDALVMSFLYPEGNWRFLDNQCGDRGFPCVIQGFCFQVGGFFCPWVNDWVEAMNETPTGGTLWILGSNTYSTGGTLFKPMTISAPLGATLTH